jgi:DNA repair protein RadA/Sms
MQQPSDSIPHEDHTRQNPLDEPPYSPELLDTIAQLGYVWLCHDQDDADLLLRPDAGDLPALCLPIHRVSLLTPELVKPLNKIAVVQRLDNGLDDGFYARYGQTVKAHLEGVSWRGTLYRVPLNDIIPTLPRLWSVVEEDRQRFQQELVYLQNNGIAEEIRPKQRSKKSTRQGPRPVVVTMSEVQRQSVHWLWWPYLAIGKLCMLDGDPGIGKTLLMTQIAASLSVGNPLPDQQGKPTLDVGGAQTTLMLSTEDGLADTLKPRLEDAGADCTKVHVLTGWLGAEDEEHAFTLQHINVLHAAIQQYHPRLIIIDPIQAYIGAIDMHRANETRPLLAALTRVAEQHQCAIVCIRHPSKPGTGDGKVIHRGLGSIDFIGAARTALYVEQHPIYPDKALMAQSKSNIGPLGRTQVYSKKDGLFRWCGVSRMTAEVMAGSARGPMPYAFLEAVCWLEDQMNPGVPMPAQKLEDQLAQEGIRGDTIKRAKKALGIRSTQGTKGWFWTLPPLPRITPP